MLDVCLVLERVSHEAIFLRYQETWAAIIAALLTGVMTLAIAFYTLKPNLDQFRLQNAYSLRSLMMERIEAAAGLWEIPGELDNLKIKIMEIWRESLNDPKLSGEVLLDLDALDARLKGYRVRATALADRVFLSINRSVENNVASADLKRELLAILDKSRLNEFSNNYLTTYTVRRLIDEDDWANLHSDATKMDHMRQEVDLCRWWLQCGAGEIEGMEMSVTRTLEIFSSKTADQLAKAEKAIDG